MIKTNLSLFNRFQGSLYGSLLDRKGNNSDVSISLENQILWESINALNHSGTLSIEQWQTLAQTNPEPFPLAVIPFALFRHDYLADFQDFLESFSGNQILSVDDANALFGWGHILSSVLRERFKAENCLPTLQSLAHGTVLEEHLGFVEYAIQQGLSLSQVIESLMSPSLPSAIALSLYCFIDTPEDFSLSFKRAGQISHPLVQPFTGALAGAYHGLTGIPLPWRLKTERKWAELGLPEQIDQFWSQWSGVLLENTLPLSSAVASPLVIQRRPGLRLISQNDYF